ncbi:unnamed protein product, partial [Protopolystoma xenopodis]
DRPNLLARISGLRQLFEPIFAPRSSFPTEIVSSMRPCPAPVIRASRSYSSLPQSSGRLGLISWDIKWICRIARELFGLSDWFAYSKLSFPSIHSKPFEDLVTSPLASDTVIHHEGPLLFEPGAVAWLSDPDAGRPSFLDTLDNFTAGDDTFTAWMHQLMDLKLVKGTFIKDFVHFLLSIMLSAIYIISLLGRLSFCMKVHEEEILRSISPEENGSIPLYCSRLAFIRSSG